jgi:hypothetical protein
VEGNIKFLPSKLQNRRKLERLRLLKKILRAVSNKKLIGSIGVGMEPAKFAAVGMD